jgi:hypothetical protein
MKTLLLAFLFLPLLVMGQAAEPFKKANVIVIETGLSPEEAYTKWGKYLVQNGFTIADSNKEFLTLNTGPKNTSKMNYDFVLNTSIQENGDIVVRSKWRIKASELAGRQATPFFDWKYRGMSEITTQDIFAVVGGLSLPVIYRMD